jgi:hypothetical protein
MTTPPQDIGNKELKAKMKNSGSPIPGSKKYAVVKLYFE